MAVPSRPGREDAIVMKLPDGREAILGRGEWFILGKDGWPDRDQPVDIHKEFGIERPAAR